MLSDLDRHVTPDVADHGGVRRFAVAWRNTTRRTTSPVGVLQHDGDVYKFWYLPSVSTVPDFRPFLGFPQVHRVYTATRLWPFFAVRVMDRKRPDFADYVASLGLGVEASSLDILSRSGGERKGDTVQVIEEPPIAADGATECTFLVRGARYATREHNTPGAVDALAAGEPLALRQDESNPSNPSALLITTSTGQPVGWVPEMLIGYANVVRGSQGALLDVVRNNGPTAPWHLRLLVRLRGSAPPGYRPFSSGPWLEPHQRASA